MGYLWQKVLSNLHMAYGLSFEKILQCRRSELGGNLPVVVTFILLFMILLLDGRALCHLLLYGTSSVW
jgi:hypothetical protein